MCGIFGFYSQDKNSTTRQALADRLFKLSEARGREASGFIIRSDEKLSYYRAPVSAGRMLNSDDYRKLVRERNYDLLIGHSRLATNGSASERVNNQPVRIGNMVGVHNVIIANDKELWKQMKKFTPKSELDSEALFTFLWEKLGEDNDIANSLRKLFSTIEGAASIAGTTSENDFLFLATNTGSLYYSFSEENGFFVFGSESYILEVLQKQSSYGKKINEIRHVKAGSFVILDTKTNKCSHLSFSDNPQMSLVKSTPRPLVDESTYPGGGIDELRRCSRCVLPETMPFIKFDEVGVCNYCRDYRKVKYLGDQKFLDAIQASKSTTNSEYDCILAMSGGRDSCYGLHILKEMGLNPVTFTYDWGMVNDLARRNISRMTAKLGVENIVISADFFKKRGNIRKNIEAWLKRPNLGMIPIFMSGDKQYFYYANLLGKRFGGIPVIFCVNPFEKTHFKTGFCGVDEGQSWFYKMSFLRKARLAMFYAVEMLKNPSYLNSSLWDSLKAFYSSFLQKHNYLFLFDYFEWNEKQIERVLEEKYSWEKAADTKQTWRIGDGTSSFYNFLYYTIAGLTENDTFKSHQIREGVVDRDEALLQVKESNRPRFETIKEYLSLVGLNHDFVIEKVYQTKPLYKDSTKSAVDEEAITT